MITFCNALENWLFKCERCGCYIKLLVKIVFVLYYTNYYSNIKTCFYFKVNKFLLF